jgi:hypothetical protein
MKRSPRSLFRDTVVFLVENPFLALFPFALLFALAAILDSLSK